MKISLAGQTRAKRPVFTEYPSFVPKLHIMGTLSTALEKMCGFDGWPLGIWHQKRHSGPKPGPGYAIRMEHHHATGPVTTAAMPPQGPGHGGKFGMTRRAFRDRQGNDEMRHPIHFGDHTTSGNRHLWLARRKEP